MKSRGGAGGIEVESATYPRILRICSREARDAAPTRSRSNGVHVTGPLIYIYIYIYISSSIPVL
jgi:hypothetical protein